MMLHRARRLVPLALLLFGVFWFAQAGAASSSTSWTQLGGSSQHVWLNRSETAISPATVSLLHLRWTIDGVNVSAPVVVGRKVYVTTSAGRLEARNAVTGSLLWSVGGIAWLPGSADNNSPAVVSGSVVANGVNNTLRAFRLSNGRLRWSVPTLLPAAGPPVVAHGTIYHVTGANGLWRGLSAYDAATGNVRWAWEWSTIDWSPPFVGPTVLGARMFVSDWMIGGVHAFATMGTPLWQTGGLSSADYAMPAATRNLVIYPGGSGLVALDRSTGGVVWWVPQAGEVERAPAVAHGVIYTGNADGPFVTAYDLHTGEALWQSDAGLGESWSSPVVANGIVWFASEEGAPVAVDERDGSVLWRGPTLGTGEMVAPTVAVVDRQLYVGGGTSEHGLRVFALSH